MNLAGVVILYYPDDTFLDRIATYTSYLQKLIIIDNSETRITEIIERLEDYKFTLIQDGVNKGIAKRLNEAARIAISENYDWLLTMDQDSFFGEGVFSDYMDCFLKFETHEKVAQFGVEYSVKDSSSQECFPKITSTLITSGTLVNLKLYEIIGGYDENLFIDFVDLEYCFRSIVKGYCNIQFCNIHLQHSIGKTHYHRSFKNLKKTSRSLHVPLRLYYITRNYLYVRSLYKNLLNKERASLTKILLYHIKNNMLYNKDRWMVFKHICKGIKDYKLGRFDKIHD